MITQKKTLKTLHVVLWIAQLLLAVTLIWAAYMKLSQPTRQLAAMWPWVGEVPVALVKFTGIIDLLGALGLVVPAGLRIQPKLTPIAAICVVLLMVCASIFHILRGEAAHIGINVFFALLAAFIAWGRLKKAPISDK